MSVSESMSDVLAERYASRAMREIWAPEAKVIRERELWIMVLRAQVSAGLKISSDEITRYEKVVDKVDLRSIEDRERRLRHDVKARIEEFNELAKSQSIHLGMTSRDVTETIEATQIRDSLFLTYQRATTLIQQLAIRAEEFKDLVIVGRSHNVPAQLTTLGKRFATVTEEFLFALERLENLIDRYPFRGLRGPVGSAQDMTDLLGADSHLQIEKLVAKELGFERILDSTAQIYPRSIDFEVLSTLVQLAAGPSSFATTLRLMAGLGHISEGFKEGQVGSSAMPHKVNARSSERINGLSVVLKGHLSMISEISGDQWNEGDVSCSVVRRVALPGAFFALDGIFQAFATILKEMKVFPGRIELEVRENLPFLVTTRLLTEAVKKGMGREDAHKIIQRHSLHAAEMINLGKEANLFLDLASDPDFPLSEAEISALASNPLSLLGNALVQVDRVVARVRRLELRKPHSSFKTSKSEGFEEII
ncbi:MAG: adenylosuccinate lyase [Candidatus Nanopelagicaceae bacterium]